MLLLSLLGAAVLLTPVSHASKLTPPVLPLVVRNPYLSLWLPHARNEPWKEWPMFYTGTHIGLSVLAAVPETDTVYPLLGRPQDSLPEDDEAYIVDFPIYRGATYDASTTNLTYSIAGAGKAKTELTLSFLSPITPTSTLRQSIPASYLSVHVSGNASVDIYIDLNGQWVSGDRGRQLVWDYSDTPLDEEGKNIIKTWSFRQRDEMLYTEHGDQAEWGTLHFSGPSDVRHESGTSAILRQRFSKTGTLENNVDQDFRGIMDEEPVFAFAKSFQLNGSATTSTPTDSALFSIAFTQNPVVQFAAARGLTDMRPLWAHSFATDSKLLAFHYLDYEHANTLAQEYSSQLASDAYKSGADDYVDIVALSARQVLGATSFSGTPDNPIIFMKEISSNGNFQTIDVIFPSFPFFLYTNPKWLAYLLEPLIEHMLSGQYPRKYAMHDLGTHFPNATGHPDGLDEYMPVEECGNILMMGLAVAQSLQYSTDSEAMSIFAASGDQAEVDDDRMFPLEFSDDPVGFIDTKWGGGSSGLKQAQKWIGRSYSLWEQWTGYLVEFSLKPATQLSTDDFAGWLGLQTGLALKGIVGIRAMAGLAEIVGNKEGYKKYMNISTVYIAKWEEYGMSRDGTHAKLAYDWYGSWTTLYNLFGDALLCFHLDNTNTSYSTQPTSRITGSKQDVVFNPSKDKDDKREPGFVPRRIYTKQSDWYYNVRQRYGLPLDSRHLYTKTDWEFFSMAVTSRKTRSEILQSVAKWVNETVTDRPFTDLHKTEEDGGFPGPNFFARPVIGGHFAFLTLERACGGAAMKGLSFLDEAVDANHYIDVEASLRDDRLYGDWSAGSGEAGHKEEEDDHLEL